MNTVYPRSNFKDNNSKGWKLIISTIGEILTREDLKFKTLKQWEYNEQIIKKVAELYCTIWREPPWNEDFWVTEEVAYEILSQTKRPGASSCLASVVKNFKIIGFTWGYPVEKAELARIAKSSSLDSLFKNQNKVFYIDELGVDKDWRGMGIGTMLSRLLLESVHAQSVNQVVLRTDIKAKSAIRLYKNLRFKDLGIKDGEYDSRTYWLKSL